MRQQRGVRGASVAAGTLVLVAGLVAVAQDAAAPGDEAVSMPSVVGARSFVAPGTFLGGRGGAEDIEAWNKVSEGLEEVTPASDGGSFYKLFLDKKNNRLLAELPAGYANQRHFLAMTVAGGETYAGLQAGDQYVRWEQIGGRMVLIEPQIGIRANESTVKASVERLFTDRVILDVGIVGRGPSGQPVIDLNELLVQNAGRFFGASAAGLNPRLAKVVKAKGFPQNIEIAFEAPTAGGVIKTFYYSVSQIQGTPGFKPREADERVGYFNTSYRNLDKIDDEDVSVRYINRWHLEKSDPSLKLSPPKKPIIYYVEHTAPVKYRRWIKQGAESWNRAFREIGIEGAVEVRFQDQASGAYMEIDPEDVRYNFIRWLTNDEGTAIGPSRVNPMTGEILDADVILTDGWLRYFDFYWHELIGNVVTESLSAETLSWLELNPEWDPRVRLAPAELREQVMSNRGRGGVARYGGVPELATPELLGDDAHDGLVGRVSQVSGMCAAGSIKGMDIAMARALVGMALMGSGVEEAQPGGELDVSAFTAEAMEKLKKQVEENPSLAELLDPRLREALGLGEKPAESGAGSGDGGVMARFTEGPMIDGLPEEFVGPQLAELVAHEVGHTLGLRHNFKGSSIFTFEEINSDAVADKHPISTSVMDYTPINIRMPGFGDKQGNFGVRDIGPYDVWAIEYGYTFEKLEPVLAKSTRRELQYGTDEDTGGADPLIQRYDLASNSISFARNQVALAAELRDKLLTQFVKDGESWARARYGYGVALGQHVRVLSMMAPWVGGSFTSRDKKGGEGARTPVVPVPVEQQREALSFVLEQSFRDEAFGLTPELLRHLTSDKWWDAENGWQSASNDVKFNIHDRVLGVQSSVMTMVLNPTTLTRVLDNELYTPSGEDMLTLPELLETVTKAAWTELYESGGGGSYSERNPMISSLRRNLQREHLSRVISLATGGPGFNAAQKPISQLATMTLRDLDKKIGAAAKRPGLDAYTRAHLEESLMRIQQSLDAQVQYRGF